MYAAWLLFRNFNFCWVIFGSTANAEIDKICWQTITVSYAGYYYILVFSHTDINNYRTITLRSCISKLLEMCLIEINSETLYSSPLQFGFHKKTGCSHALYSLRNVIDFDCASGSTVNVALLDMSKAFDRVNHNVLFNIPVLLKRGMPPMILQLLMTWYRCSNVFVR